MRAKLYLHRSKESNYEKGVELGLSEEAMRMFLYACCEVEVTVHVDEETGKATILTVNGCPVFERGSVEEVPHEINNVPHCPKCNNVAVTEELYHIKIHEKTVHFSDHPTYTDEWTGSGCYRCEKCKHMFELEAVYKDLSSLN